jgi:hypothetical protein
MRKFDKVYKEKLNEAQQKQEDKTLSDFKKVYSTLLESYNVISFYDLNDKTQTAFCGEIDNYWREESGITEKGKNFLEKKTSILTESSTQTQKKNYLKSRTKTIVSETLRQTDVKYRIYDTIDKMYQEIKADNISEVLSPSIITNILKESFTEVLNDFIKNIDTELNESEKENKTRAKTIK